MGTALTNSLQLWPPAENLHTMALVSILSRMGKVSTSTLSSLRLLMLVGNGHTVILSSVLFKTSK